MLYASLAFRCWFVFRFFPHFLRLPISAQSKWNRFVITVTQRTASQTAILWQTGMSSDAKRMLFCSIIPLFQLVHTLFNELFNIRVLFAITIRIFDVWKYGLTSEPLSTLKSIIMIQIYRIKWSYINKNPHNWKLPDIILTSILHQSFVLIQMSPFFKCQSLANRSLLCTLTLECACLGMLLGPKRAHSSS